MNPRSAIREGQTRKLRPADRIRPPCYVDREGQARGEPLLEINDTEISHGR
jgi:hypothetical protein